MEKYMWLTNHKQLKPKYPCIYNYFIGMSLRGLPALGLVYIWNGRKYKKMNLNLPYLVKDNK